MVLVVDKYFKNITMLLKKEKVRCVGWSGDVVRERGNSYHCQRLKKILNIMSSTVNAGGHF